MGTLGNLDSAKSTEKTYRSPPRTAPQHPHEVWGFQLFLSFQVRERVRMSPTHSGMAPERFQGGQVSQHISPAVTPCPSNKAALGNVSAPTRAGSDTENSAIAIFQHGTYLINLQIFIIICDSLLISLLFLASCSTLDTPLPKPPLSQ